MARQACGGVERGGRPERAGRFALGQNGRTGNERDQQRPTPCGSRRRRHWIGIPGLGMGRRGGMGHGYPTDTGSGATTIQTLMLRWESVPPVREAELKARETNATTVDENHYAIAV